MKNHAGSISVFIKKIGQHCCFIILLLALSVACTMGERAGTETAVPQATPQFDEATGLELNPVVIPAGDFVVMGRITAVTLIPQDEPLIKVISEDGRTFQIIAQPVPQITYEDGTAVPPLDIKNGVHVRATVQQNGTGGLGGEPVLVSPDLVILLND